MFFFSGMADESTNENYHQTRTAEVKPKPYPSISSISSSPAASAEAEEESSKTNDPTVTIPEQPLRHNAAGEVVTQRGAPLQTLGASKNVPRQVAVVAAQVRNRRQQQQQGLSQQEHDTNEDGDCSEELAGGNQTSLDCQSTCEEKSTSEETTERHTTTTTSTAAAAAANTTIISDSFPSPCHLESETTRIASRSADLKAALEKLPVVLQGTEPPTIVASRSSTDATIEEEEEEEEEEEKDTTNRHVARRKQDYKRWKTDSPTSMIRMKDPNQQEESEQNRQPEDKKRHFNATKGSPIGSMAAFLSDIKRNSGLADYDDESSTGEAPTEPLSTGNNFEAQTRNVMSLEDIEICQKLDNEYERALEEREIGYNARYASVRQSAFLSVIFMVGYLALGTAFFIRQTEWTIPSSLLFSIYTITTVGYGNHHIPKTPGFQLYVIFYILIGIAALTIMVRPHTFSHSRKQ